MPPDSSADNILSEMLRIRMPASSGPPPCPSCGGRCVLLFEDKIYLQFFKLNSPAYNVCCMQCCGCGRVFTGDPGALSKSVFALKCRRL